MDPLINSLMLKMRHNRVYTVATFSRLFSVSEKVIETALATLLESGKVRACLNARRDMGYCLAGAKPSGVSAELSDVTTVATLPVTRCIDGALAGYERQLDAHRSLAMLTRR
jgi:predicted DNA-binding transcriptional regulator